MSHRLVEIKPHQASANKVAMVLRTSAVQCQRVFLNGIRGCDFSPPDSWVPRGLSPSRSDDKPSAAQSERELLPTDFATLSGRKDQRSLPCHKGHSSRNI